MKSILRNLSVGNWRNVCRNSTIINYDNSLNRIQFSQHNVRRNFLQLPFQSTRRKFTDQKIVNLSPNELFDVVANVDDYHKFVPNCVQSNVTYRSPNRLEAQLTVGISYLVTESYTSIVNLHRPNRILIRTVNSKVLKHLNSEWTFETVGKSSSSSGDKHKLKTLVTFRTDFEFHSRLHSNIMDLFFDDFTKNVLGAFLARARVVNNNNSNTRHKPVDAG